MAITSGDFYDVPWSPGSPLLDGELLPAARTEPSGWQRNVHGPWLHLAPCALRSEQGWKVHVSALPGDAAAVAAVCFDACVELTVTLKVLRSRGLVLAGQQKYAPLTSSGKVVTCYPEPDQLEPLCRMLADRLAGHHAPRVLGELQVPDAPITLRHGAFRGRWVPAATDGRPVPAITIGGNLHPDIRGVPTGPRPDDPEYVRQLRAAATAENASRRMDVQDVTLLHRSNAGGVYRARTGAGDLVLLKEARHHAGLDLGGSTAPDRLRHEDAALHRMAGSGVTPEPVDFVTVGDSDFLVMEFIEGTALNSAISARHPVVRSELTADESSGAAYVQWVDRVDADARRAVALLHERGVVHRDLQPANLIDTGDRVVVIDLESCAVDGVVVSRGVATPGFSDDRFGAAPEDDLRSLDRVRSMLLNPLTPLLHRRRDLEAELLGTALADLGVTPAPVDVVAAPDAARIAAGIAASASVERADRLFPGDAAQFSLPRGGVGLLHGAAGTLLALTGCGHPPELEWIDWLAEHATAPGPFPRGLGDGAEGVAWALARLGRSDTATEVLDRFVVGAGAQTASTAPWWRHGIAGRAVALAALATLLDSVALRDRAAAGAAALAEHLRAAAVPPGHRPGLTTGWAGIGLAVLALHELLDDAPLLASLALERELATCRLRGTYLLGVDGKNLLPYLGYGSAAAGLLAARLLVEPDLPDQARAAAQDAAAGVRAGCACPVVSFAGLMTGRAGLLIALDAVSGGTDPMVAEHRRRLDWHTVELRIEDSTGGPALGVLGEQNLRCSADLATGAAGVLTALHPHAYALMTDLLCLSTDRPPAQSY